MLYLLLLPFLSWGQPLCTYVQPQAFTNYQVDLKKTIESLANNKPSAALADKTLGKLLTAKSPAITRWMSRAELKGKNDAQIVRAWREYYLNFFVLNAYPNKNPKINKVTENLVDSMFKTHLTAAKKNEIKGSFKIAKDLSLKAIHSWSLPPKAKKALVQRVQGVQLYWPSPFKEKKLKSALDVLSWSVNYDPVPNRINIGLHVLRYPNTETLIAVFAHEIGHSFDPCRFQAFFKVKTPFAKIYTCLRGSDSAQALKRDDSLLEEYRSLKRITETQYMTMKVAPYCNKTYWPPAGKQKDQLPEVFADWFSAEAMSHYPQLTKSLRSDLCENVNLLQGSSYISYPKRLTSVYFAQPKISKRLELKTKSKYCSLNE